MRARGGYVLALLAALAAVAASAAPAGVQGARDITVIGDSVATGIIWHDDAVAALERGLGVDWEVAVCRRLIGTSCPFQGSTPPNALDLIHSLPHGVAPTVVVEMGYNDAEATFASAVDQTMQALIAAGARHVLWLTLRETRHPYVRMNDVLAAAAVRYPQLSLVDWNRYSRSHPEWFQSDGEHLDAAGGLAMARLTHLAVMKAVDPLRLTVRLPVARLGHTYRRLLRASGGTPPYRFGLVGRPPRGLHLLANGRLFGMPRSRGTVHVTLQVADAEGQTVARRIAIVVR